MSKVNKQKTKKKKSFWIKELELAIKLEVIKSK